jgi:peptidoglycan hydrolase CwlO-like protein
MELEERVLELEKDFAGIDHGRFERIEHQNEQIFSKINQVADSTARLDERMRTMEKSCSENEIAITNLQSDRDRKSGGLDILKWVIPVSIALTGIIVGLVTWGIDRLAR